jgi:hypothetical protein
MRQVRVLKNGGMALMNSLKAIDPSGTANAFERAFRITVGGFPISEAKNLAGV